MVERISPNPITETLNPEPVGQFLLEIKQTALWSRLGNNEQLVLEIRHLQGLTLEKTARQIGVTTRERVRQIEVDAWGIILHSLSDQQREQVLAVLPNGQKYRKVLLFDHQVAEFKKEDKSNSQIAQELGIRRAAVAQSAHRLIAAGKIERAPRPVGPTAATIERDTRVEQLRKAKLSNPEIAQRLKISRAAVEQSVRRLIAAGKIERLSKGRPPKQKSTLT